MHPVKKSSAFALLETKTLSNDFVKKTSILVRLHKTIKLNQQNSFFDSPWRLRIFIIDAKIDSNSKSKAEHNQAKAIELEHQTDFK